MPIARIVINNQTLTYRTGNNVPSGLTGRYFGAPGKSTKDSYVGKVTLRGTTPVRLPNGTTFVPSFTFPYAPHDINVSGMGDNYENLTRPGKKPLVFKSSANVQKVDITALVVNKTKPGVYSCEQQLEVLRGCARIPQDFILVGVGSLLRTARFRFADLSVKAVRHNPSQEITMAEASISLTEVPDDQTIYPIPGMIAIKDVPLSGSNRTEAAGFAAGSSSDYWVNAPKPG
jgi:hypothetical protein